MWDSKTFCIPEAKGLNSLRSEQVKKVPKVGGLMGSHLTFLIYMPMKIKMGQNCIILVVIVIGSLGTRHKLVQCDYNLESQIVTVIFI